MRKFSFFAYNEGFKLFGTEHLVVIGLMIVLSIALPIIAKRYLNDKQKLQLSRAIAVLASFWALAYVVILLFLGDFNYKTDLPLDLCNISALLLPFLMWNPRLRIHEVLYFWILAGTIQAILTPHLYNGFPNFIFIKYWFVHCGLVIYAIYATVVFDLKPNLKSIFKSFLALQTYVFLVYGINYLLGSNYVYVMHKPPTASALDYLGDWPYYILAAELIAFVFFFIVYLPIALTKKKK
ncbi:MAG: TIGR02206 family membrane protein [Saprospiraceae bacterium]